MDEKVDNMLKQEAKKSNEAVKKVIGYLAMQKSISLCHYYSSMYCNFAGTDKKCKPAKNTFELVQVKIEPEDNCNGSTDNQNGQQDKTTTSFNGKKRRRKSIVISDDDSDDDGNGKVKSITAEKAVPKCKRSAHGKANDTNVKNSGSNVASAKDKIIAIATRRMTRSLAEGIKTEGANIKCQNIRAMRERKLST
jgi:hypothetical protein